MTNMMAHGVDPEASRCMMTKRCGAGLKPLSEHSLNQHAQWHEFILYSMGTSLCREFIAVYCATQDQPLTFSYVWMCLFCKNKSKHIMFSSSHLQNKSIRCHHSMSILSHGSKHTQIRTFFQDALHNADSFT